MNSLIYQTFEFPKSKFRAKTYSFKRSEICVSKKVYNYNEQKNQ